MTPALSQENGINTVMFAPWSWHAAAKMTGSPSFSRARERGAPCDGDLSPSYHPPSQLQAEPELSCCILHPTSRIPHPASLLRRGTMEHQPHHMPMAGAGSGQNAEMLMPPGTGRELGTQSRAPQGTREEAAASTSQLKRLPVGSAAPGLLF